MYKRISTVLLLIACGTLVASQAHLQQKTSLTKEFDFFYLVRQWPGSFCNSHACPLLHNHGFHFTIHGLWPNYADGSYPQFCDSSAAFDEHKIADLLDNLEDEWPSYLDSDESFWQHEWTKHGTCSSPVLTSEHRYFAAVLKLHRLYNIEMALLDANIQPDAKQAYSSCEIKNALKQTYGVDALVHSYNHQLSEIWFCIDKDLKAFDCQSAGNTCEDVYILPLGERAELQPEALISVSEQPKMVGTSASPTTAVGTASQDVEDTSNLEFLEATSAAAVHPLRNPAADSNSPGVRPSLTFSTPHIIAVASLFVLSALAVVAFHRRLGRTTSAGAVKITGDLEHDPEQQMLREPLCGWACKTSLAGQPSVA